jgi:hypothetical protein
MADNHPNRATYQTYLTMIAPQITDNQNSFNCYLWKKKLHYPEDHFNQNDDQHRKHATVKLISKCPISQSHPPLHRYHASPAPRGRNINIPLGNFVKLSIRITRFQKPTLSDCMRRRKPETPKNHQISKPITHFLSTSNKTVHPSTQWHQ